MKTKPQVLLSITKAAKLLSIHPLTLRNWAEKGYITFFKTPGGHRRFRERDLLEFLSKMNHNSPESTLETMAQHAVQQAIATLPNQHSLSTHSVLGTQITEQQRGAMRLVGRKLLGLTIQYAAGTADESVLNKAKEIARTYGKFASHNGLSLSEMVATFNMFRNTIIDVTFDTSDSTIAIDTSNPQLYRRLNYFFNEILLVTVQAAEETKEKISKFS